MKENLIRRAVKTIAMALAVLTLPFVPAPAAAADEVPEVPADPFVVVSMGDSYSSGEGIEKFYDQDLPLEDKIESNDWLAHRSQKSWPGRIKVPGTQDTVAKYKTPGDGDPSICQWYFVAASGAETKHFSETKQRKKVKRIMEDEIVRYLPPQINVFDSITDPVDYVTLSIGGNDVEFAGLIETCAINCSHLYVGENPQLKDQLDDLWDRFPVIQANIKNTYRDIAAKAGDQAEIVVAGYPQLINPEGSGGLINVQEAKLINSNVSRFNRKLKSLAAETRKEGIHVHFVDVEKEFNSGSGHLAYTDDPWIRPIEFFPQENDLDGTKFSAYSIHPNSKGAAAYARCINAKIEELENNKGTLAGSIVKASDRRTTIAGAKVTVYQDGKKYTTTESDYWGVYIEKLPAGDYFLEIEAEGYIKFRAYAKVVAGEISYTQTFLMIEGQEGDRGIASGTISNSLTGVGLEGVTLHVREDWNNISQGDPIEQTVTDENGGYELELPVGNYTLYAEKEGYISESLNIIVQPGTTDNQNGTITPVTAGDAYRVVLTWGSDPRDLDSHVRGTLTSGDEFHVYFSNKEMRDGDLPLCELDVDDRFSYGPETITLNVTTETPYYYYVYRYAGRGTLSSSDAKVTVYKRGKNIGTFNVPTNQGGGDYWNVFAIVNGELIVKNTISDEANLNYALPVEAGMFGEGPGYSVDEDRYPEKPEVEEPEESSEPSDPTEENPLDPSDPTEENPQEPSDPTEEMKPDPTESIPPETEQTLPPETEQALPPQTEETDPTESEEPSEES